MAEFPEQHPEPIRNPDNHSGAHALNADLRAISARAPHLRHQLLVWGKLHGRRNIPWKVGADGRPAADGAPLDPYPIWVAEVKAR